MTTPPLMITKTQLMAPVLSGLAKECFEHSELGVYDVTAMRAWCRSAGAARAPVEDIPLSCLLDHIKAHRVTDQERVMNLPEESWRDDPGIFIVIRNPEVPGGEEHLMIDGHHRALRRNIEGKESMLFYMVPERYAIRPAPGWGKLPGVDWGEEIRDGQIIRRG